MSSKANCDVQRVWSSDLIYIDTVFEVQQVCARDLRNQGSDIIRLAVLNHRSKLPSLVGLSISDWLTGTRWIRLLSKLSNNGRIDDRGSSG